jgi:hypothetical protein
MQKLTLGRLLGKVIRSNMARGTFQSTAYEPPVIVMRTEIRNTELTLTQRCFSDWCSNDPRLFIVIIEGTDRW